MNKLKLLIFIDWYKPGYKAGGPIRSVSNFVAVFQHDFDIFIITRDTDYLETTPYLNIKPNEWNIVDGAKVFYLSNQNKNKKKLHQLIDFVAPNLIYCNSLYSPYFSLIPIYYAKNKKIKTILAVRGMLSKGSLAVKKAKKKAFINFIKWVGLFKNITFHATTIEEKLDIENTFGKQATIFVVNNLPNKKTTNFINKKKKTNHIRLVVVARIAPEKNTLYAIKTLKKCKTEVHFDIFGPIYDPTYWNKCLSEIKLLPKNITVQYKGALNHDEIDAMLQKYHALFLPSTGENFGHIIVEAMANSCVPIISNKTPWKGLEQNNVGFDIDLSTPQKFAEAIDNLALKDEKTFNEIAENTFRYSQQITNNQSLTEQYRQLFHH